MTTKNVLIMLMLLPWTYPVILWESIHSCHWNLSDSYSQWSVTSSGSDTNCGGWFGMSEWRNRRHGHSWTVHHGKEIVYVGWGRSSPWSVHALDGTETGTDDKCIMYAHEPCWFPGWDHSNNNNIALGAKCTLSCPAPEGGKKSGGWVGGGGGGE